MLEQNIIYFWDLFLQLTNNPVRGRQQENHHSSQGNLSPCCVGFQELSIIIHYVAAQLPLAGINSSLLMSKLPNLLYMCLSLYSSHSIINAVPVLSLRSVIYFSHIITNPLSPKARPHQHKDSLFPSIRASILPARGSTGVTFFPGTLSVERRGASPSKQ